MIRFRSASWARFSSGCVAIVALALGCSVERTAPECSTDSDCVSSARGSVCYRGFCVAGQNDGGTDAGPPDGGAVCTPNGMPCEDSGLLGICMEGTLADCPDGTMRCLPLAMAAMEQCNGTDDDCDGTPDDGIPLNTVENCGACGASCGDGLQCCTDVCVDTTSDDAHCGGCGAMQACDVGGGERCCGSSCQNLLADNMNCGVCGRACPDGQACCEGECVARDSDPDNCGGCGTVCAGADQCCRGMCGAATSSRCQACAEDCESMGLACCNGSCVDLQTDSNHCGTCPGTCSDSEFCCAGDCVTDDATHCGACGVSCDAGTEICCGGGCVSNNSPNCGACGVRCDPGTECCGNGCFDLATDRTHCGDCGMACTGTESCSNGHCCAPGTAWCGGPTCVDLQTSGANCGTCGHGCVLGCTAGRCNLL